MNFGVYNAVDFQNAVFAKETTMKVRVVLNSCKIYIEKNLSLNVLFLKIMLEFYRIMKVSKLVKAIKQGIV